MPNTTTTPTTAEIREAARNHDAFLSIDDDGSVNMSVGIYSITVRSMDHADYLLHLTGGAMCSSDLDFAEVDGRPAATVAICKALRS